jgi:hypothetical protein
VEKIKTLFVKDENHLATEEIQCPWVFDEGVKLYPKWDGTSCAIIDGEFYKRYDAKKNKKTGDYKVPPEGSIPCCDPDPVTGHWPHWTPVLETDKYHLEAYVDGVEDGTYELVGPKVNGNNDKFVSHALMSHKFISAPVFVMFLALITEHSYSEYLELMSGFYFEGVVLHHPDGRMCKVRRKDFGLDWPLKEV